MRIRTFIFRLLKSIISSVIAGHLHSSDRSASRRRGRSKLNSLIKQRGATMTRELFEEIRKQSPELQNISYEELRRGGEQYDNANERRD